jgi:ASC-1-like (ASCH) protein
MHLFHMLSRISFIARSTLEVIVTHDMSRVHGSLDDNKTKNVKKHDKISFCQSRVLNATRHVVIVTKIV